jgi:hypothetical protein
MSQSARLAAAGIDLSQLPGDQREVLSSLSAEELDVLVGIKHRLDGAAGEVEGHVPPEKEQGGLFW